jgi:hypothetical protein
MRRNSAQVTMRGYRLPQVMLPGTSGVSDNQKLPDSSIASTLLS